MPQRSRRRQNIYTHSIDLANLYIKNAEKEIFRQKLEEISYRGYEVEKISDGRSIVITKPGGKLIFGAIKREDFMVWIYNPEQKILWLISHKNILDDLKEKGLVDPKETLAIISVLGKVYKGKEPDDVLKNAMIKNPAGESPEVLLKAYKWIWGQEDVNYPTGKGRAMSWEGLKKNEMGEWEKTGQGITDLRDALKKQILNHKKNPNRN